MFNWYVKILIDYAFICRVEVSYWNLKRLFQRSMNDL